MNIRLDSVGCRLNIGEIEAMARRLAGRGHRVVPQGERADLCILNSCAVTAIASRKSRHFIRQLRRNNPKARLVVTGCLAELEPETLASLGVDLVIGNDDKDRIPTILHERGLLETEHASTTRANPPSQGFSSRTRAFLKVQDGCDSSCAYCVVTIARGAGRSLAMADLVDEIGRLVDLGFREIVLSGVHLGSYGHDLGRPNGLEELVLRILNNTGVRRLRLSSLEPWDLDDGFFRLFTDPRLLPHLHLPLQSGCDATLKRMARKTTADGYSKLVAAARSAIPDVSISTDIMVGFPGETDTEFEESLANVTALEFSRLHVFRFSRREGTAAAAMPGQVPGPVSRQRSRRMHELGARLAADFHRRFVNRQRPVLWESAEAVGPGRRWSGLTDNYIRVLTETNDSVDLTNRITEARLEHCIPGAMLCSIPGVSSTGVIPHSHRSTVSLPLVD
jgi:threonylcarbamoyladenosine tRNA methylthiotransferase MtaB